MRMCVSAEIVSGYPHPRGYPDLMRPSLAEEDLEVAVNADLKAFQGKKALSAGQLNAIDLLQKSKQIYFNAKSAEEYDLLPHLVKQTIETFRLARSFLTWKETLAKLNGWNPYKEKAAAALWAKFKKNPVAVNSTTVTVTTSANNNMFKGYKIPKNSMNKDKASVKNDKFMTSLKKKEMEESHSPGSSHDRF
ncbi:hypothetical protein PGTUg99_030715 [Puccinia graminis f. sp. tritici]|uniref:Uncharacterized protein n=1 Tax=Puccinia graminis f. sp. tritici TaxID=56615 RepID=A0A5B0SKH8_PUCGR|nr:hypothetical protein PGTUg99_030715 [Puccinia graminis f. sp. tritici]